jgi:peptidoglycan/LPS O-acetylase OafA/YrhL
MTSKPREPGHREHLTHPKYRADIDGLRAIAVLFVMGFHAFPTLVKGGFIGVDIFFVISGYLISTIILENLAAEKFSFLEFARTSAGHVEGRARKQRHRGCRARD